MSKVLEVVNLNYQDFKDINLSFNSGTFYSIVGASNSGKTTLFKLMASLIPSNNVMCCNDIFLNNNYLDYLVNIGIVERVNNHSFIYKSVLDEMKYPLYNLGYSKNASLTRIDEILSLFKLEYFKNKDVNELSNYDKQKLLIIIALLHNPKVLLLDSVLDVFPINEKKKIIKILKVLVKKGLTVINFTKQLDLLVDKVILIDKYSIVGEYDSNMIFEDDKLFYSHNLEIPFMVDLSIKLKMYGLVDKEYSNMKEMVDDLWP